MNMMIPSVSFNQHIKLSVSRNAGFDPAKFRVDQYGNVLYFHADSSSPLAWDIDHWFPHSSNDHKWLTLNRWTFCNS